MRTLCLKGAASPPPHQWHKALLTVTLLASPPWGTHHHSATRAGKHSVHGLGLASQHQHVEPTLQLPTARSRLGNCYLQWLVNIPIIICSLWINNTRLSVLCADPNYAGGYFILQIIKEWAFTWNSNTKSWLHQVQLNTTALRHETDGIDRSEVLQIKSKTELLNIHSEL